MCGKCFEILEPMDNAVINGFTCVVFQIFHPSTLAFVKRMERSKETIAPLHSTIISPSQFSHYPLQICKVEEIMYFAKSDG